MWVNRKNSPVFLLSCTTALSTLWLYVWVFHISGYSVTPAGYPKILIKSCTVFLELASDPNMWRTPKAPQPHPCLPCSGTRTQHQTPIASPCCYLCFWPPDYESDIPVTPPSLGLFNLLEWLMELKKTVYLLVWACSKRIQTDGRSA